MTREWKDAVHSSSVHDLQRLLAAGADINARDSHNQTALTLAAHEGNGHVVAWLVEHGAALDHTAKYGLSALMLAVVGGHIHVVRQLIDAGASVSLRGTGAPGFAEKTALDLAMDLDNQEMVAILRSAGERPPHMTSNPHFVTVPSWKAARSMLTFQPLVPAYTAGLRLQSIRIHVRDHKVRDLSVDDRTLEAHYAGFVLSQARKGDIEAQRLALAVPYGRGGRDAQIAGCPARVYERGPEPEPGDIDGRSPAVVTWRHGEMFYLIASDEMAPEELVKIAISLYK